MKLSFIILALLIVSGCETPERMYTEEEVNQAMERFAEHAIWAADSLLHEIHLRDSLLHEYDRLLGDCVSARVKETVTQQLSRRWIDIEQSENQKLHRDMRLYFGDSTYLEFINRDMPADGSLRYGLD